MIFFSLHGPIEAGRPEPDANRSQTGIAAAGFSRVRNADLTRFTLDRPIGGLNSSMKNPGK